MMKNILILAIIACILVMIKATDDDGDYQIGTAIYDVTGPPAEVGMMGYAMVNQRTRGIHLRLRTRAYIIVHKRTQKRTIYVNSDICMCMQSVKVQVMEELKKRGLDKYYNHDNVILGATHTHSGPAGFSWYALYDITSFGFEKENFKVIVNGIVNAIEQAHKNISKGGKIFVNSGRLLHANINRSPTSYTYNPEKEREKYKEDGDTEKEMISMRFENEEGKELGMIAWFPVHCTSMNNTNHFISSDNKGYASYLFEKKKNGGIPGEGDFVAAFGQANEGDVSPNTRGPSCPNGDKCDSVHSTCGGKSEGCIGKGPGKDMFESTAIIGQHQFDKAWELYHDRKGEIRVEGEIDFRHQFVDMSNQTVNAEYTSTHKTERTCPAAMGFSFAAGTTDGPGDFSFIQGDTHGNPFWKFISSFLKKPTEENIKCQAPKPILLDVGEIEPIPWIPNILPMQIVRFGKQLIIVAVPAEFTTMSGRRIKERVKETLIGYNMATNQTKITVSGLANGYSGYVATYEEYLQQRYEAASTVFGPHTLAAYTQVADTLAKAMGQKKPVGPGPTPPNLLEKQWSFRPGVVEDTHPIGKPFGTVETQPKDSYQVGEQVEVSFWGAHPNNNLQIQGSYLAVERNENDKWETYLVDGDWDTKFKWTRRMIAESEITITWDIAKDTPPGTYRIKTKGVSKSLLQHLTPYEGTTQSFKVHA